MGIFAAARYILRMKELWPQIAVVWYIFVVVSQARCKNLRNKNTHSLNTLNRTSKYSRQYIFWTNASTQRYPKVGGNVKDNVDGRFSNVSGRIRRENNKNELKRKLGQKVSTLLPQPAKPLRVVATSAVIKNRRKKPSALKAIHIWGPTPFKTVLENLKRMNANMQKQNTAVKRLFLPVQLQRMQLLNALGGHSLNQPLTPFSSLRPFFGVNSPLRFHEPLNNIHEFTPQSPEPVPLSSPVMSLPPFRDTGSESVLEPADDFDTVHQASPAEEVGALHDTEPESTSDNNPIVENSPPSTTSEVAAAKHLTPATEYEADSQFVPKSFEIAPSLENPSVMFGPPQPPFPWLAGEIHEEVNRHVKKGTS